jgi:4-alpha-glucanotransferase
MKKQLIPSTSTLQRSAGILLHVSSLPSRFGIGDLGYGVHQFLRFLKSAGQKVWQILPVGPTGFGNSPYSSFSAFAGNHLFLSPEFLLREHYITNKDIDQIPEFDANTVNFESVIEYKNELFQKAFHDGFWKSLDASSKDHRHFFDFCKKNASWLGDYALFMALKDHFGQRPWIEWDKDIRLREKSAIRKYQDLLLKEIFYYQFLQYEFSKQWQVLRRVAQEESITIMGDIPIFVAYDSADVWANRQVFRIKTNGKPSVVTGVPPDYFSSTGQRWGNPHYDWTYLRKSNFQWWIQRFQQLQQWFDIVRIDHFRGFEAAWEVKESAETAENGKWKRAPGKQLFSMLSKKFPSMKVVAEDLGVITDEVTALRHHFELPGMKVMQFGLESCDPKNAFLPHNFEQNTVVYSGTHDNDTTLGWFESTNDSTKNFIRQYLQVGAGSSSKGVVQAVIRAAYTSSASLCIIPIQDVLCLGSSARMNIPGKPEKNWTFRITEDILNEHTAQHLQYLAKLYNR